MAVIKNLKYLPDSWSIIEQHCRNMDVLDIGAVAHYSEMSERNNWIHGRISKIAKYVIGVDILKEEVDILRKKGYNIIHGNAETINLGRTFDVVMAGDTIAQLSNQGLFLDNMLKHLKQEGVLIITSHNILCWWLLRDLYLKKKGFIDAEHLTHLTDVNTISHLLKRHGFTIKEMYYHDSNNLFFCKYVPSISDTILIISKKE